MDGSTRLAVAMPSMTAEGLNFHGNQEFYGSKEE
jgi:hypothetical protein